MWAELLTTTVNPNNDGLKPVTVDEPPDDEASTTTMAATTTITAAPTTAGTGGTTTTSRPSSLDSRDLLVGSVAALGTVLALVLLMCLYQFSKRYCCEHKGNGSSRERTPSAAHLTSGEPPTPPPGEPPGDHQQSLAKRSQQQQQQQQQQQLRLHNSDSHSLGAMSSAGRSELNSKLALVGSHQSTASRKRSRIGGGTRNSGHRKPQRSSQYQLQQKSKPTPPPPPPPQVQLDRSSPITADMFNTAQSNNPAKAAGEEVILFKALSFNE